MTETCWERRKEKKKKKENNKVAQAAEKLQPSYTAGGNVTPCNHFGKESGVLPKAQPAHPIPRTVPEKPNHVPKGLCSVNETMYAQVYAKEMKPCTDVPTGPCRINETMNPQVYAGK